MQLPDFSTPDLDLNELESLDEILNLLPVVEVLE